MSELPNKLPLRQKVSPPSLRYSENNNSPNKPPLQPVQLFTRNDVQSLKYGGFTPIFQTDLTSRNGVINMDSVRKVSPLRASDPYSRPFIPRQSDDIPPSLDRKLSGTGVTDYDLRFYESHHNERSITFQSGHPTHSKTISTRPSSTLSQLNPSIQPYTGPTVQTNSFMRPKSAIIKSSEPVPLPDGEAKSESESESDPGCDPTIGREIKESRSFVLFPNKLDKNYELTCPTITSSSVPVGRSESVIRSLQRPISGKAKLQTRNETENPGSSPLQTRKSDENLYSAASGNALALRRKVKLTTTAASPNKTTPDKSVSSARKLKSVHQKAEIQSQLFNGISSVSLSKYISGAASSTAHSEVNIRPSLQTPVTSLDRPMSHTPPIVQYNIRNPRYTPTKPYHEVKDPLPPSNQSTECSQTTFPIDKYQRGGNYRMNSSMKIEDRPQGDGAPAVATVDEKGVVPLKERQNKKLLNTDGQEERLPGDGEASVENSDDDRDEYEEEPEAKLQSQGGNAAIENDDVIDGDVEGDVVDNLDDDVVDFSGDDSDGISMNSSLSVRSCSASLRVQSARRVRSGRQMSASSTSNKHLIHPGLTPSLFTGVPPTITFVTQDQRVHLLPWDIRKLLKWRLSPITPNIVKSTVARSGFRISKRNYDWIGCFGRHMKSQCFKMIRDYQKINHFPGSFQIGRKDRLWRNLYRLQVAHGKKEFSFFPQTYVLPTDLKRLKQVWDDNNKQKWIIKPPASARGIGIRVIHKWSQIPKRRPVIVQKYLAKPYLINQSKFDLRIYVYVTSYDPLRIYVFEDGLVRFASQKYSSSMKHLNNKFVHLTNYSINKQNSEYQSNADETVCQGHKWALKALWGYLENNGVNTNAVWNNIKDVCIKCIISAESPINSQIKSCCRRRYCVHELFGFDIFLDDQLKPWIIEVNISPSLHSNSQLDVNIKGSMVKDLLNLAGFMLPDKRDVVPTSSNDNGIMEPANDVCIDKRLWQQPLTSDEKAKHAYFVSRTQDSCVQTDILGILTPDDIRILIETLDEESRSGAFQRVFPSATSNKYFAYFEQPRYYNLLLDAWAQKYSRKEQRGIELLETYCHQNYHLASSTMDPAHQWAPPNQMVTTRTQSAPSRKLCESLPIRTSFTKKTTPGHRKKKTCTLQSMSLSSVSSIDPSINIAITRSYATDNQSRDAS